MKKNLVLLPTNKPTRLVKDNKENKFYLLSLLHENTKNITCQNIYITSDEEIKEGDWCVDTYKLKNNHNPIFKWSDKFKVDAKKIILTTDQSLGGVQAIEDEFLRWFIQNDDCEFVEVLNWEKNKGWGRQYKILIPREEVWKDIPDYEGYYQVSNLGNVKSLTRNYLNKNGDLILLKEKSLIPRYTLGYYVVGLCKDGFCKNMRINILVAICFLNHKPDGNNIVVDHINEIKTDNRLDNLRLISHRENVSRNLKGTSKYVGVYLSKKINKWVSKIIINGECINLGSYDNEEEAAEKYLNALNDFENDNIIPIFEKKYKTAK